jgi:hypothetical protein
VDDLRKSLLYLIIVERCKVVDYAGILYREVGDSQLCWCGFDGYTTHNTVM